MRRYMLRIIEWVDETPAYPDDDLIPGSSQAPPPSPGINTSVIPSTARSGYSPSFELNMSSSPMSTSQRFPGGYTTPSSSPIKRRGTSPGARERRRTIIENARRNSPSATQAIKDENLTQLRVTSSDMAVQTEGGGFDSDDEYWAGDNAFDDIPDELLTNPELSRKRLRLDSDSRSVSRHLTTSHSRSPPSSPSPMGGTVMRSLDTGLSTPPPSLSRPVCKYILEN